MARHNDINPYEILRSGLRRAEACDYHPPLSRPDSIQACELWWKTVEQCSPTSRYNHLRWLCLNDLYFLGAFILHRWWWLGDDPGKFPDYPRTEMPDRTAERHAARNWTTASWYFNRCREYESQPWRILDIWSRESGKSEILTFAANIQSLLKDPNESIGIMSHSRPIAKYFLHLIMRELEQNEDLKGLFPDILWSDPKRQAQPWGEDVGIVIRRKTNRRESSIEAWGLIDGQPTGKRYTILSYDDVIARQETTIHMIPKATEEFRNSLILSASSGDDPIRFRYAGTFQELGDTNQQLIDAGFEIRLRPSVAPDGSSLCLPDTRLAWFRAHLTAKEWALQFLLDPSKAKDDSTLGFRTDWIQYYEKPNTNLNALTKYIFVDPAGTSPDTNSHYVLAVVGLSPDKRKKVIDLVYDKLNLDDRTKALKHYATKYQVLRIFYEKAAMQADIEHIRGEMRRELWECPIIEVGDNQVKKDQRIEWLLPEFSEGMIQLPKDGIPYRIQSPDLCRHLKLPEGAEVDLVKLFIEREYDKWPTSQFKDILDALSWMKWGPIQNMLVFPRPYGMDRDEYQVGGWGIGDASSSGGWMTG